MVTKILSLAMIFAMIVTLTSCATAVKTAEQHPGETVGAATGAATGAVVGAAMGKSGTAAVIGGLLGGLAGGVIGHYAYDTSKDREQTVKNLNYQPAQGNVITLKRYPGRIWTVYGQGSCTHCLADGLRYCPVGQSPS